MCPARCAARCGATAPPRSLAGPLDAGPAVQQRPLAGPLDAGPAAQRRPLAGPLAAGPPPEHAGPLVCWAPRELHRMYFPWCAEKLCFPGVLLIS